jgi:hypothetical protein
MSQGAIMIEQKGNTTIAHIQMVRELFIVQRHLQGINPLLLRFMEKVLKKNKKFILWIKGGEHG